LGIKFDNFYIISKVIVAFQFISWKTLNENITWRFKKKYIPGKCLVFWKPIPRFLFLFYYKIYWVALLFLYFFFLFVGAKWGNIYIISDKIITRWIGFDVTNVKKHDLKYITLSCIWTKENLYLLAPLQHQFFCMDPRLHIEKIKNSHNLVTIHSLV